MRDWLKISHYRHSGRLRPHEHTSYLPLTLLVLVVGLVLTLCSAPLLSEASPGPQAGSIGLTGTVPKAPPKEGATITSPKDGQRFDSSPISVLGNCPANTLVEIYKNDIFAGSALCDNSGTFSLKIDLLSGNNKLIARVYDVLNQAGPDSAPVNVFYTGVASQAAPLEFSNFTGQQLLLSTDSVYRGIFPQQPLNVPISIIGGIPPYAVNVQWGDGKNNVIPRGDNQAFNASHAFSKSGTFQITLQATDSQSRVAFLTIAAIVNGQPTVLTAATNAHKGAADKLLVLWPLYVSSVTLIFSFWLGEQREKRLLKPTTF